MIDPHFSAENATFMVDFGKKKSLRISQVRIVDLLCHLIQLLMITPIFTPKTPIIVAKTAFKV